MEVTIVTAVEHSLDPTRHFGVMLNNSLSVLKMLHWYSPNFNFHELVGSLYNDLTDLFDSFQEEIIGTSKAEKISFPSFSPDSFCTDKIEIYSGDLEEMLEVYDMTTTKLLAIFNSREIDNYINSVTSGLNNTKEGILSRINKSNYLISMLLS